MKKKAAILHRDLQPHQEQLRIRRSRQGREIPANQRIQTVNPATGRLQTGRALATHPAHSRKTIGGPAGTMKARNSVDRDGGRTNRVVGALRGVPASGRVSPGRTPAMSGHSRVAVNGSSKARQTRDSHIRASMARDARDHNGHPGKTTRTRKAGIRSATTSMAR